MNIVLHEPEIPANVGNIGRTCVATNSRLCLIKPLGFFIDDKSIKRAGLDYWKYLDVSYYDSYSDFLEKNNYPKVFYSTTKARKVYSEVAYGSGDFIMFGKESAGIPEEILVQNKETAIRIPMYEEFRSLNLANSVAIVLYEALRQQNFSGLKIEGNLHRLEW